MQPAKKNLSYQEIHTNADIVPWQPKHVNWLRRAIRSYLQAGYDRGGDLSVTDKNVETYLLLGLEAAKRNEPCLIFEVSFEPVAFVFWLSTISQTFDQRWRTMNALGSYTEPEWRSYGIADRLRLKALEITKALRFDRIVGPVHFSNTRGVREFIETYDAWPTVVTFEKHLGEYGAGGGGGWRESNHKKRESNHKSYED